MLGWGMMKKGHKWLVALAAGTLACGAAWAAGEAEGVYADVAMEGGGGFTVRLETEKAARAAAAFVGLATGEAGWLDWDGRAVSGRPYYDGRLMHRVVPGAAVQGGAVEGPQVAWEYANNGEETLLWRGNASFVGTNLPGVTTNAVDMPEFSQPLAAAKEAALEWQGRTWRTVATNQTREFARMLLLTGRGGTWTTNRMTLKDEWVSNGRLEEVVRPYSLGEVSWTVTNTDRTAQICTNVLQLSVWYTNRLAVPRATGGTNFLSAGFTMPDCATNGLKHVRGAVSMARSLPNTDGAQFFVCTTDVPGWDGQYTVFGTVTEGMETVDAMAAAAVDTNANNRPLEDLRIGSVRIRRVGAAAEAWDWRTNGVPEVGGLALRVERGENGAVMASGAVPERCEVTGGTAGALAEGAWLRVREGYFPTGGTWRAEGTAGTQGFFTASAVQYAEEASAVPETVWGRTLRLEWTLPDRVDVLTFPAYFGGRGRFVRLDGTNVVFEGNVFQYTTEWSPARHSAGLVFEDNEFARRLELRWEAGGTNRTFLGTFRQQVTGQEGRVTGRFRFVE